MAGGPFSGILGGLLGGDSANMGTGILGNMNTAMTQNAGTLLGLGAGLMSGDYGMAANGALAGMQQDQRTRLIKQKQAEEEQKKVKALELANQYGLPPAFASDPDSVFSMVQNIELKKRTPKELTFQERLFNQLPEDQRAQAVPALLGLNKDQVKWEIKTIKNADGSETPVYFNPLNPAQTMAVPGYGAGSPKAAQQQAQAQQAAGIVVQDIDRALEKTNNGDIKIFGYDTGLNKVTGGVGQALSNVGGTEANDVSGLVDTIQANATFDKLQAMRAASPTGAALGAVSDTENKLLGAAIGSLKQSQTKEQFVTNLKRVKKIYNEVIHGKGNVDDEGNVKTAQTAVQGNYDRAALEAEARRRGLKY